MERIRGIEPLSSVWKTDFQPLGTRVFLSDVGGVDRNRTGNLFDAIEVLSSLSYDPLVERPGVAPGSLPCESSILLLKYRPENWQAAKESNPLDRVLEARRSP